MEELKNNGVVVIPHIIDDATITKLKNNYMKYYSCVHELRKSNKINHKIKYRIHLNDYKELNKNFYSDNKINIIELQDGKYDISFPDIIEPKNDIVELIEKFFMKGKYKILNGFLSSNGISPEGDLHRDTLNLNSGNADESIFDDTATIKYLNPFYFTVLIPLVDLNKDNGSTKFILESHKKLYNEIDLKDFTHFDVTVGSVIIFDGRIIHKAGENKSLGDRPVFYYVFHKDWYTENY